jgi:cation diffusion facilitator family transporter
LLSLGLLGLTALAQAAIFALSGSVALLADLIHNVGDALTAVPLGLAFLLRSLRGEKLAGLAVVLAIFISACVALYETIQRLFDPQPLSHLWVLAAAGVIGFAGNELAARVRLRAGRRLASAALVADGNHARVDGFVSLGVVASAAALALGAEIADPIVGLLITLVILKITWDSWRVIRSSEPGELADAHLRTAERRAAQLAQAKMSRPTGRRRRRSERSRRRSSRSGPTACRQSPKEALHEEHAGAGGEQPAVAILRLERLHDRVGEERRDSRW